MLVLLNFFVANVIVELWYCCWCRILLWSFS